MVLLCLMTTPGMAAEPIGRLFMTPEERADLDALRALGNDAVAATLGQPHPASPDQQVVLNGVVRRSRGPDVVWVNGARATLEQASGALARLKPGQVWIPATGRVTECFGCVPDNKPAELISALPAPPVAAPVVNTAPAAAAGTPDAPPTVQP